MELLTKIRLAFDILGLVVVGLLISKGCRRPQSLGVATITLAPNDKLHARIDGTRIETVKRVDSSDKTVRKVETNYHHGVDIIQSKDGLVKLVQKTYGFEDEYGMSTDFKRIGIGMEPFFYHNFHALLGVHFIDLHTGRLDLIGYVAIAYRFPYEKVNNLSVYGGYDTSKHIIGGMYLRFGSL